MKTLAQEGKLLNDEGKMIGSYVHLGFEQCSEPERGLEAEPS